MHRPPAVDEIDAREDADPGFRRALFVRLWRVCLGEFERGERRERAQHDLDSALEALRKFRAVLLAEHGYPRIFELEDALSAAVDDVERDRIRRELDGERFVMALYFARRGAPAEIEAFDRLVPHNLDSMLPRLRPAPMSAERQFVRHATRYATLKQIADALDSKSIGSVRQMKSALRKDPASTHTRVLALTPDMVISVEAEKAAVPVPDRSEWPDED